MNFILNYTLSTGNYSFPCNRMSCRQYQNSVEHKEMKVRSAWSNHRWPTRTFPACRSSVSWPPVLREKIWLRFRNLGNSLKARSETIEYDGQLPDYDYAVRGSWCCWYMECGRSTNCSVQYRPAVIHHASFLTALQFCDCWRCDASRQRSKRVTKMTVVIMWQTAIFKRNNNNNHNKMTLRRTSVDMTCLRPQQ